MTILYELDCYWIYFAYSCLLDILPYFMVSAASISLMSSYLAYLSSCCADLIIPDRQIPSAFHGFSSPLLLSNSSLFLAESHSFLLTCTHQVDFAILFFIRTFLLIIALAVSTCFNPHVPPRLATLVIAYRYSTLRPRGLRASLLEHPSLSYS